MENSKAFPQIYGHIKDFSADYSDNFVLGVVDLEMEAAQNSLDRTRLIILHKIHRKPGFFHIS